MYEICTIPDTPPDFSGVHPDGVTQCILLPGMKEIILSQSGFPNPVAHPLAPAHRIASMPGAGLGMFATRQIKSHELIHSERPLLVSPAKYTPQDRDRAQEEWDKMTARAVMHMTQADQEDFSALNGGPSLRGIAENNGFDAQGILALLSRPEFFLRYTPEQCSLLATGKLISRANHSCQPNAAVYVDASTFALQLIATRDIAADEQITVPYCDLMPLHAERKKKLEPYGFTCTCPSCTDPALSDERRRVIGSYEYLLADDIFKKWVKDPALPDDHLEVPLLVVLALMREESLQDTLNYMRFVEKLVDVYAALGNQKKFKECVGWNIAVRMSKVGIMHTEAQQTLVNRDANPAQIAYMQTRPKLPTCNIGTNNPSHAGNWGSRA
ncbi:SET domain-containing protein [Obba rivulosa]|uniref:SET domain-containing protein n=1 Tax=Obba rivulosa TaxID=1052685 RepID=A0A8E2AZD3_9APHY|nr:SET domain-containing protein [Obba rivulosa]